MDRIKRNFAGAFREAPHSKYQSEATGGARLSRLFNEAPKEQYVAQGTVIFTPKSYEDVERLIDHLRSGEQVIVDFSSTNQGVVARILDFMSGAIYALGGSVKKITQDIFLFAPNSVDLSYATAIGK